eukprot:289382-Chlamydomonas_euryale.AAC.6
MTPDAGAGRTRAAAGVLRLVYCCWGTLCGRDESAGGHGNVTGANSDDDVLCVQFVLGAHPGALVQHGAAVHCCPGAFSTPTLPTACACSKVVTFTLSLPASLTNPPLLRLALWQGAGTTTSWA